MSEREEEVPQLDADAKAFLARHRHTGDPSSEALERVRAKLTSAPSPAPAPQGTATITRLPQRRPLLPPEVKAAAAVVILLLGAQALYLALRERQETTKEDPQLGAVANAWRTGDFEMARRLASKECNSEACGAIAGELAQMLELTTRVEQLSDDERGKLDAFDKKLSDGKDSALRRRLNKPPPPSADTLARAQELFKDATEDRRARNYERAAVGLEKCVKIAPTYHPCLRLLGSVYSSIATRDQSANDLERARKAYERFLEVAPPDDQYVPKVRAILEMAENDDDEPRERVPTSSRPPKGALVKDDDELRVGLGEQELFTLGRPFVRIAVGDPEVADVKTVGNSELLIIGMATGKTTLLIWGTNNQRTSLVVEVTRRSPSAPSPSSVNLVRGGYSTVTLQRDIVKAEVDNPSIAELERRPDYPRELTIRGQLPGKTAIRVVLATGERARIDVAVNESKNLDDQASRLLTAASVARSQGHYLQARRLLKQLLILDPNDAGGLQLKAELRAQARETYRSGYLVKDSNPQGALQLFRLVTELTDPDDESHQKALKQLKAR